MSNINIPISETGRNFNLLFKVVDGNRVTVEHVLSELIIVSAGFRVS